MTTEQTGGTRKRRPTKVQPELTRRVGNKVRRLLAVAPELDLQDHGFNDNDLADFDRAFDAVHEALQKDQRP